MTQKSVPPPTSESVVYDSDGADSDSDGADSDPDGADGDSDGADSANLLVSLYSATVRPAPGG